MGNWWTVATIKSDEDRNDQNHRIRKLTALAELLRYAAKLVYQTARGARALAADVANNRTVSSYPEAKDILQSADLLALDSPHKFGEMCKQAAQILEEHASDLESERHEYAESLSKKKGLVNE